MAIEKENHDERKRPAFGGHQSEDADFELAVQGMLEANFEDWPNEAGMEGLNEIRGPIELPVKGSIPAWAAGTLYRTGPGQYVIEGTPKGTFRTTHWFDGLGHSHRFNIIANSENGDNPVKVEYTSRRQSQALYDAIKRDGKRPDIGFGQKMDPCIGLFGKIMSVWKGSPKRDNPEFDNVSVAIQPTVPGLPSKAKATVATVESGHRKGIKNLWLTTDHGHMKEIDQTTLEPIGIARQEALNPLLRGPLSCAHAQRDPETGDYYNYNLQPGYKSVYRVFRAATSTGATEILATISAPDIKPAYIHSFFFTPSFVILCIPSSHLGMMGLSVPWKRNMVEAMETFDESKLCKWFVIDRLENRGVVATFDSPAAFYFHSVNSFEERDEKTGDLNVYCDVMQYPNLDVIRAYELDVMLQRNGAAKNFWGNEERNRSSHVRLTRWKLRIPESYLNGGDTPAPRRNAEKIFEIKAPHAGELPTINPAYATKKHRYVYSVANRGYSTMFDTIVKTDVSTLGATFWDNPKGHTPGEPIFVPRPKSPVAQDLDEDDGVLLSVVLDGTGKTSYLLCLDAKTLKEVGRAECDFAIGFGFHGIHWPSAFSVTSQL
ncbi:torulene oxygenase [Daldinia caldariorum]|uniref:torulene oxygenase n=1 Tax=Daldinia caldariorum TaxID=326644 RepID=UPI002007CF13|nr:torulene oxygenase [Daldinia caldariorum]KAI1467759.1 torulene oxygenase [Daldinia caldariorum]